MKTYSTHTLRWIGSVDWNDQFDFFVPFSIVSALSDRRREQLFACAVTVSSNLRDAMSFL